MRIFQNKSVTQEPKPSIQKMRVSHMNSVNSMLMPNAFKISMGNVDFRPKMHLEKSAPWLAATRKPPSLFYRQRHAVAAGQRPPYLIKKLCLWGSISELRATNFSVD